MQNVAALAKGVAQVEAHERWVEMWLREEENVEGETGGSTCALEGQTTMGSDCFDEPTHKSNSVQVRKQNANCAHQGCQG